MKSKGYLRDIAFSNMAKSIGKSRIYKFFADFFGVMAYLCSGASMIMAALSMLKVKEFSFLEACVPIIGLIIAFVVWGAGMLAWLLIGTASEVKKMEREQG